MAFGAPPPASAHHLLLFDYTMRQMLGVRFLHLFFVHDYACDRALEKVEAFKRERLRKPPPLVVHSAGVWYLLHKHPDAQAIRRVDAYGESADALVAWMDAVREERNGIVFLGKSIAEVYEETACVKERTDEGLRVQTVEIR